MRRRRQQERQFQQHRAATLSEPVVEVATSIRPSAAAAQMPTPPEMEPICVDVLNPIRAAISRRQAWQFEMILLREEGQVIIAATTRRSCIRAAAFGLSHFDRPVQMVIMGNDELHQALDAHYPFPSGQRYCAETEMM